MKYVINRSAAIISGKPYKKVFNYDMMYIIGFVLEENLYKAQNELLKFYSSVELDYNDDIIVSDEN